MTKRSGRELIWAPSRLEARRAATKCFALTVVLAAALGLGLAPSAKAEIALDEAGIFKAYGDFRLRYEDDWDSQRADGTERADRKRLRNRTRLGINIDPIPEIRIGARIRTGNFDSQQSPHITFADFSSDSTGKKHILPDKWFVRAKYQQFWAWGGRNSFPYWKQNELFWDDDVTPAGGAAGFSVDPGFGELSFNGGYFLLPDGGLEFNGNTLGAGQLVYSAGFADVTLTAAGGLFFFAGEPGAENLRNGNGARDYTIWVGNLQAKTKLGEVPLKLGLDLMHNSKDYAASDPDPFTAANRDETDGLVANITVGQLKEGGDWLAAYYYAYLETFSLVASYGQDDWVRFGSATQTDSSDFKGHEFRLAYAITDYANLVARLYIVDAITSVQDAKRFRLDLNMKF